MGMSNSIIYSKHSAEDRCGVAFFSSLLARQLRASHVHNFHGFGTCEEFYVNMDILELREDEIVSLLNFVRSGAPKQTVLLMHDYRFTYLEDQLVGASDLVVNLSGEPGLQEVAGDKMIELYVPPLTEIPTLGLKKTTNRPVSLGFGFFTPGKKSFNKYVSFYEHMLRKYPDWYHIIVASSHEGDISSDSQILPRILNSSSIMFQGFLSGDMLAELTSVADLGVCFYPTGIMVNNAAPASFFAQGKPVITTYGGLTPDDYRSFTLDADHLDDIDLANLDALAGLGANAVEYYRRNLTWEKFVVEIRTALAGPRPA